MEDEVVDPNILPLDSGISEEFQVQLLSTVHSLRNTDVPILPHLQYLPIPQVHSDQYKVSNVHYIDVHVMYVYMLSLCVGMPTHS